MAEVALSCCESKDVGVAFPGWAAPPPGDDAAADDDDVAAESPVIILPALSPMIFSFSTGPPLLERMV